MGGVGLGWGVRVDVNEIEVFVKIQKNIFFLGGGRWGEGVGVGLGGQSGCERRIEVFVKIQKKIFFGGVGGGGGRGRGQDGCERRITGFVKIQKKNVHHSPDLGMTEIGLTQQYSSQQPMAESVIRFVTFT